jgi:hypothetical protein
MSLTKRVGLVAGAALTLSGVAYGGTESNDQDLRARVAQMEAELAKLKSQEGSTWLNEQRAGEIRALVQDVLADADTRASLLQGGGTAGWDNNFYLASADGNNRLNIGGQLQVRYIYNFQDDGDDDSESGIDSNRSGFENTRTKLVFWGHVFNPSWTYKVEGDFNSRASSDSSGGALGLEDAWINYDYGNGWGIKVGQYRLPFLREELVHSAHQLAVERSLVNDTFTAGISQGLMIHGDWDQFRFSATFSDGLGGANTPALAYDTEWAFTGRGEIMFAGTWDQFNDFTSWRGEEFGLMVGAAAHYQDMEYGTPAGPEVTTLGLTADVSIEFGGANLYGAFVYTDFDDDAALDFNPWGAIVQGGFFLTDDWELFGRFEWADSDDATSEDLMIATIGVNKYWNKHGLKWTTDVGYGFDAVESFWVSGSGNGAERAGWRADASDEEDGQFVIRTQLQLLF